MKRKTLQDRRPSQAGFTLIEILVVVMIITLLASIVAVNVLRKPGEARISTAKMQIRQLQTAIQLYRSEQGLQPSQEQGLEALVAKPTTEPIPQRRAGKRRWNYGTARRSAPGTADVRFAYPVRKPGL